MIKVWRQSKARYTADLSGLGAARDGQRWNPPGQPASGLPGAHSGTAPLVFCSYALPDESQLIERPDPSDLLPGWDAIPHSCTRAAFGGRWLRAAGQLALVLPSVVVS